MKFILTLILLTSVNFKAYSNNKIIIGSDTRYPITESNRTQTHDSIGLFIMLDSQGKGAAQCTGTLISKRHVITAAHCLMDQNGKQFSGGYFYPGVNQDLEKNHKPTNGIVRITRHAIYPLYFNEHATRHDVGIIELEKEVKYNPLTITSYSGEKNLIITGYPGDKTFGTQWEGHGSISQILSNGYNVDTYSGQSGSAVRNKSNQIIGIHSAGLDLMIFKRNLMAPLTQDIIKFLKAEMK